MAVRSNEPVLGLDPAMMAVTMHDGQRNREVSSVGWVPYLYMPNFVSSSALTTALSLPAVGGSIAIPFYNPGHMLYTRLVVRNTDTTLARSAEARLYYQKLNNGNSAENTLDFITGTDGTLSFTAAAASTQAISASADPTYIPPGVIWLVFRNTHATNTFGVGSTAVSAALASNAAQTKTLGSSLGTTLDFVAATWTKVSAMYAIRLEGRVFGQTSQF
jgi:hypothetical protein